MGLLVRAIFFEVGTLPQCDINTNLSPSLQTWSPGYNALHKSRKCDSVTNNNNTYSSHWKSAVSLVGYEPTTL